MPFGDFVNLIPPAGFLLVHIVLFVVGLYLAKRSFDLERSTMAWGFLLFSLAEVIYMTYHLNVTVFLFAHTLAEVADVIGFILVFVGATREVTVREREAVGTGRPAE